jgi:Cu-processing system permease protein
MTWGHRIDQVLLLTRLTWKEGLRRRMLLIGFLLTLGFVALYGLGAYFAFHNWQAWAAQGAGQSGLEQDGALPTVMTPALFRDLAAFQMLSFGMFVASFLGAMLVIFSAAGAITGDAENGTLQTIVTRPIARSQILAGRFLGYGSIFLAYVIFLSASLIILTRTFAGYAPPDPAAAVALLVLQGVIILGIVFVASAELSPITAGIVGFMAFGLSFVGGIVEQIGSILRSPTAEHLGRVVGYLVPSHPVFSMAIRGLTPDLGLLTTIQRQMGPMGGAPVRPGMIAYSLVYVAGCLALAGWLFARKDL